MRHGIPTCGDPIGVGKLFMRLMYHEWYFGPFNNENEVADAMKHLDSKDSWWDYDTCHVLYGLEKAPEDAVRMVQYIPREMWDRIIIRRRDVKAKGLTHG